MRRCGQISVCEFGQMYSDMELNQKNRHGSDSQLNLVIGREGVHVLLYGYFEWFDIIYLITVPI